ncbi:SDR family NAD(P)-dependent oxidoreductase [Flavimaricola marinus]|uniref:Sepiapterin reductase n=1 Tax=Flavimaricola marinus TaxID=1819565 RepID=A0A238L8Z9_9RHOB|nr:SDR family NAD(P)-dependent oxidoreductase [Flavimaricola marinus]SMY06187.1 Sepiapterin reductase [Flavimaricola marinus]
MTRNALIVGAGDGLSASLARLLAREGYALTLVARDIAKLDALKAETGATLIRGDATDVATINALVDGIDGRLDVAIYNPSARVRGPLSELDPEEVRKAVEVTAFGSFVMGQAAARRMLTQDPQAGRRGTVLFTGASAGVKGFAKSAAFAMGKFAQRGLAQSMSRELHPQGVHVAWVNIDGAIRNPGRNEQSPDAMLSPDAIAKSYLALIEQDRSAWSDELTLRPWVETF